MSTSEFYIDGFSNYWMDNFEVIKCNSQIAKQKSNDPDVSTAMQLICRTAVEVIFVTVQSS